MRRIGDYDGEYVRRSSPWMLALKIFGALFAVSIVLSIGGFAFGWFKAGTDIISPQNVKAQWQFAYDYSESLNAVGGNWCTAKQAEDAETNPDAKLQRQTQRIAQEQNYNRIKAEYDARLADAFRAKWVKPADVPTRAPTLTQTTAALGCK